MADRRLARLEVQLSPLEATLLWLREAHEFGSLPAYVAWLREQPMAAAPLVRVPGHARAAVAVTAYRGHSAEELTPVARAAIRDAVFLVELVLELNARADEARRTIAMRAVALTWQLRPLLAAGAPTAGQGGRRAGKPTTGPWHALRTAVAELVGEADRHAEARARLEGRYLGGHTALFPAAEQDWASLRQQLEGLARACEASMPSVGRPRRAARAGTVVGLGAQAGQTAGEAAARWVSEARAATLDVLGDGPGAAGLTTESQLASPASWKRSPREARPSSHD